MLSDDQITQIRERLQKIYTPEDFRDVIDLLDELQQMAYLTPKHGRTWKDAFEVERHDRLQAEDACARLRTALEAHVKFCPFVDEQLKALSLPSEGSR